MKLSDKQQEFEPAEFLVDKRTVGDETGDGFGFFRLAFHVVAAQEYLPGRGLENPHHDPDRSRLACAIGTQEAKDLAVVNLEIEGIDGGQVAVVFGEVQQLDHINPEYS
jgi:hypothetical protein